MKGQIIKCAAAVALMLCLPGLAAAADLKCRTDYLKGQYVFSATGFTRAPNSTPGTPWVPKAILQVLQFNGDGTLTSPVLTLANPFGDAGNVLQPQPPPGGLTLHTYTVNDDCSGTVQFRDAANVAFKIQLDGPFGLTMWMMQINPANNVLQGAAKRVR